MPTEKAAIPDSSQNIVIDDDEENIFAYVDDGGVNIPKKRKNSVTGLYVREAVKRDLSRTKSFLQSIAGHLHAGAQDVAENLDDTRAPSKSISNTNHDMETDLFCHAPSVTNKSRLRKSSTRKRSESGSFSIVSPKTAAYLMTLPPERDRIKTGLVEKVNHESIWQERQVEFILLLLLLL